MSRSETVTNMQECCCRKRDAVGTRRVSQSVVVGAGVEAGAQQLRTPPRPRDAARRAGPRRRRGRQVLSGANNIEMSEGNPEKGWFTSSFHFVLVR